MSGLAWDYSLAIFRDRAGDDDYRVGDFSLGASAHGSAAFFLDEGGSDRYSGTRPARRNEGSPNLSLFLDRGEAGNLLDNTDAPRGCRFSADYGYEFFAGEGALPPCPAP